MIWRTTVIVVILGLGVLFFLGLSNNPKAIPSPLVGKMGPTFTAKTVEGEAFSTDSLKGSVALITFWASWCTTCKADEPLIDSLKARYRERDDFRIIGVATQDSRRNIEKHLQQGHRKYTNLFDEKGHIAIDFGVYGVPETYLLDRDGKIVEKMIGPINRPKLNKRIRELLEGETAG